MAEKKKIVKMTAHQLHVAFLFFCCGFGKESVVAVLFVDFLDFVFAEGPVFTIAKHPKLLFIPLINSGRNERTQS